VVEGTTRATPARRRRRFKRGGPPHTYARDRCVRSFRARVAVACRRLPVQLRRRGETGRSGMECPRHRHAPDGWLRHVHRDDSIPGDLSRRERPLVARRVGQHHVMGSLRKGEPCTDEGQTGTQGECCRGSATAPAWEGSSTRGGDRGADRRGCPIRWRKGAVDTTPGILTAAPSIGEVVLRLETHTEHLFCSSVLRTILRPTAPSR